jgi:hypothetical protein
MNVKRGEIVLEGLQVKSLAKARLLAKSLQVIEEECGIHEVRITIKNSFVCAWINLTSLNRTPMERLVAELLRKIS